MKTVLSHDAYGRFEVLRKSVQTKIITCAWCGRRGKERKDGSHTLYRYGNVSDGYGARENWDGHLFCGKSCYESYHA